ncbi:MAG: SDR family oxidoreductase [Aestuariivirga sp.]
MTSSFKGKSAIITGAARGIGLGIARILVARGARVLLVDQNGTLAEQEAKALRQAGAEAIAMQADVSRTAEMKDAVAIAIAAFGRIDILCPNAAVFDSSPIATMTEALWDRLLSINLKGVFLSVQACLPQMTTQAYGRIVVTSSITGNRTAIKGMAHYAASKAGINGFVRAAAMELAQHGITINCVEPGHVMTEGAAPQYDAAFKQAVESFIPLGRFALPEDIGRAVLFLASDDAAYVTGQSLVVDGGVTLPEYPPGFPAEP